MHAAAVAGLSAEMSEAAEHLPVRGSKPVGMSALVRTGMPPLLSWPVGKFDREQDVSLHLTGLEVLEMR